LKLKRKNNFLTLIQSAGILLSVVVSLFAHSTLAAVPIISHHIMIPANSPAAQVMLVSSSQVYAVTGNSFSSTQSSLVQSAESSLITPLDQVTLQQSEALQKNVYDSQLIINTPANLLEQPTSIIGLDALSISYASPVLTISNDIGYAHAQTLGVVQEQITPIIEPFAFGNSDQQLPAQAVIPLSSQHKNNLSGSAQFNSDNIATASVQSNSQINILQFAKENIEVLRC
jgi:hypothetical protein